MSFMNTPEESRPRQSRPKRRAVAPTRITSVIDRLIQADRGLQLLLQPGVEIQVVVPQRLLDHQQSKLVEFLQVLDIIKSVRRVRVATDQDVRPALANALQHEDALSGPGQVSGCDEAVMAGADNDSVVRFHTGQYNGRIQTTFFSLGPGFSPAVSQGWVSNPFFARANGDNDSLGPKVKSFP